MTRASRISVAPGVAIVCAIALFVAGAAAAYLFPRPSAGSASARPAVASSPIGTAPSPVAAVTPAASGAFADVTITLSAAAKARAGIAVAPVTRATMNTAIRVPAIVEPNAYTQVVVTPLVAGQVRRVMVQLGDRIRSGRPLAEIYSPELAEARTRFIAARAMLQAHDRELQRTVKLAEIGAASRQEVERLHAEHSTQLAEVDSARARLRLLGAATSESDDETLSRDTSAVTTVRAPRDGTVIERLANAGSNVDVATRLFTVVDLSTVWVIADLFERDFGRVQVGSPATVMTPGAPGFRAQGRVSYIDPQVRADTRTAKVRIEVPNVKGELRLGMYADVSLAATGESRTIAVPQAAIQHVGDRTVVYLPAAKTAGEFVEHEISVGSSFGDLVEVLSGLHDGDSVVTEGSFFLRAERERLGTAAVQTVTVTMTETAFNPSRLRLRAGMPARVTFLRTSEKTCATEVRIPSMRITRSLPVNTPVTIEFTPTEGEVGFVCGMGMLRGSIIGERSMN